jgi:small subunit ribosomal protein S29
MGNKFELHLTIWIPVFARQKLIKREKFSEEKWKKMYYLSNGNGSEMRWLAPFI